MSLTCSASDLSVAARRRLLGGNRTICHSGVSPCPPGGRQSIYLLYWGRCWALGDRISGAVRAHARERRSDTVRYEDVGRILCEWIVEAQPRKDLVADLVASLPIDRG